MVEKRRLFKKISIVSIAYVTSILTLFPFVWMLSTSFKSRQEVFEASMSLLPRSFNLTNYEFVFANAPLLRYLLNSVLVTSASTVGVVVTSLLAGYAFSRIHFPLRNVLFLVVLGTMMIPHQSIMIPSFILLKNFGWLDSYNALIIPFLVYPFAIFIIRNFFMAVPKELEEAAFLDGCSRLRTLIQVFVPISLPAVASVVIFNFTYIWNDFFWPLVMTSSVEMRTIQVGLAMLKSEFLLHWPVLMSATVISAIPIFVIYLMFQKFFVQGTVSSGVKG